MQLSQGKRSVIEIDTPLELSLGQKQWKRSVKFAITYLIMHKKLCVSGSAQHNGLSSSYSQKLNKIKNENNDHQRHHLNATEHEDLSRLENRWPKFTPDKSVFTDR